VWARETEKEKGCAGGATGADKSAPLGSEQEGGKGARDRLPLTGGTLLSRVAGARACGLSGLVWARMAFPFSLSFLIPFLFLFSRIFNSIFKLGFKSKLIQTCATIQRIFKLSMMQHVMTHSVLAKINN
jgi:ABC-type multidrug transport system fused ATPase/permease subunit